MKKEKKKCYETKYCCFCKRKDCDKRIEEYGIKDFINTQCNGDCFECNNAIRSISVLNFLELKMLNIKFNSCIMYKLLKKEYIDFYGKTGEEKEYSKIELAILQLQKCEKCQNEKIYYNLLKQISDNIEEIPRCFESMTNLTSNRILEITNYSIADILSRNNYNCKVKIEVIRIIKEYLNLNKTFTLEDLCEYIVQNRKNIDYYIHPLTISSLLIEIEESSNNDIL